MTQWVISSQATKKLVEGSTTRESNLSFEKYGEISKSAGVFCLEFRNEGDIIWPNYQGGHIMQGRRILDVVFSRQMLKSDYAQLKSVVKIAKKYGVSKKCILNYMNRFGIPRQRRLVPIAEVRNMAAKGMSAPEIAEKLAFTPTAISKIGRQANIAITDKFHKGYIITDSGHIAVKVDEHPFSDARGYVRLHRLIMEKHLGRFLRPDELVHHINEKTLDNRIENLQVMTKQDHVKLHHTGKKGRGPDKNPRKKPAKKQEIV